jgi:outer membrane protein OmpA-like peptidoglycan-associated protein
MGGPNSPPPEWAKALGPDFLKFLEETDFLEFLEETNAVAEQPVPEPDLLKIFDLLEDTKEVSAAHTVAERPDKTPQQILTEMGVTSVSAEPPRENTAIVVPAKGTNRTKTAPPMPTECSAGKSDSHLNKSSPLPGLPSRSTDSSASEQLSRDTKKRVNTSVGSGVRINRPGNMAVPQQGNYARKKRPQRPRHAIGVRQAFIAVTITCLIIGVSWRAGLDRAAGPARLSSTMTQAPAASNSDVASEPSPKPTPVSNLPQAAALSATAPANRKIAARILFAFDSSELDSESEKTLRGTMEQISTAKNPAIEIHGYSDSVGAVAYNQFLSEERARAVRNYLLRFGTLGGVPIKIVGHGSDAPAAPDSNANGFVTPERRKTNRRVEVILYDSSGNATGN